MPANPAETAHASLPYRAGLDILSDIQSRSEFPLSVGIGLTGACNLSCPHCEVPRSTAGNRLDLRTLEGVFEDLAGCGVLSLALTGGEPTLREDLKDIVGVAARRTFLVQLKTNGFELDDESIAALVDAGLGAIHVSLYSPDAEAHDTFVGRSGAFRRALRALRRCAEAGLESKASLVAMAWNTPSLPRLLDLLDEHGLEYFVDCQLAPHQGGRKVPAHLRAEVSTIEALVTDPRLNPEGLPGGGRRAPDSRPCLAGWGSAFVNHDGEIWPCARLRIPLGNVLEGAFSEQWLGSPERRRLIELRWRDLIHCADCGLSGFCDRCPAIVLAETSDLLGRSGYACSVARAFATAAAKAQD